MNGIRNIFIVFIISIFTITTACTTDTSSESSENSTNHQTPNQELTDAFTQEDIDTLKWYADIDNVYDVLYNLNSALQNRVLRLKQLNNYVAHNYDVIEDINIYIKELEYMYNSLNSNKEIVADIIRSGKSNNIDLSDIMIISDNLMEARDNLYDSSKNILEIASDNLIGQVDNIIFDILNTNIKNISLLLIDNEELIIDNRARNYDRIQNY